MSKGMAVIVKPTYACNAACDYCEVYKWGDLFKPMDKETFALLEKKLNEHFKKITKDKAHITFYWLGGEPLMMSDEFYGDVLDITKNSSMQISHAMQSNLIPYAKKDFKNLKELLTNFRKVKNKDKPQKDKFVFSTSADPVSDARKLKNGKSYDEAFLKSIFQLKKDGAGYAAVYTVHSGSIGREKEIYHYFKNLGFNGININAMCDYAGKFSDEEFGMSVKDYGTFMIEMWKVWARDDYKLNITPFNSWKKLRDTGSEDELRCYNDGKCDASLCAVGPNGDVFTCDRAMQAKQLPLGSIKKDSFDEMFKKKIHKKRVSYLKENDCKGCAWWSYCKGSCPYESRGEYEGRFEKSYWCESYKMLFEYINHDKATKSINYMQKRENKNSKKIFSLPFTIGMSDKYYHDEFLPFLAKYKDFIYDIYFTHYMPPFENDAMGTKDIYTRNHDNSEEKNKKIFSWMMDIQKRFGIKVSATFNNILVEPTKENLDLFIQNLKPLYKKGLRSITIPHYTWMSDGSLKRAFPDMTIKNTILKNVSKPQEYVDYAKNGFDVINIDRYNLRDRDNLKRLKKAYDRYKVPMVILANEWCRGLCPAMSEHYQYNCSNGSGCSVKFFDTALGHTTCPSWGRESEWYSLKNANLPVFRKDVDELLQYVQIFKLHGRSDMKLFYQSLDIIKSYADGDDIVFKELYKFMQHFKYDKKKIEFWNKYTKNCKFECWDCKVCEDLHKSGEKARQAQGELVF